MNQDFLFSVLGVLLNSCWKTHQLFLNVLKIMLFQLIKVCWET